MGAGTILRNTAPEAGGAWRETTEVAVAYVLTECALWSSGGAQLAWGAATLLWVLLATAVSRRTPRQLGLLGSGLRQVLLIAGTAALAGGLMVLTAWYVGEAHSPHGNRPFERALLYSVWSLLQEFLTQSFVFVRLETVLGSRWAVIGTALLFSLADLPNPILTPATLLAGLVLTLAFRRYLESLCSGPCARPSRTRCSRQPAGQPYPPHAGWHGLLGLSLRHQPYCS